MDPTSYSRPDGCHDHDVEATARRRAIEARLLDLFRRSGYGQITLPTVEYADLYSPWSIGSDLYYRLLTTRISESALFPTEDSEGRRISDVVLRPELTAPVARYFASRRLAADEPVDLPARLAYAGQVFRNVDPAQERLKELRHVGVELVGSDRRSGDLEILCLACDAAAELGLPAWRLVLGHSRLCRQVLRSYGLDDGLLLQVAANVEMAARIADRATADDEVFLRYVRDFLQRHSRFPADHPGVEDPDRLSAAEWRDELPALNDAYLRRLWSGAGFGLPEETVADLLDLGRLRGEPESFFPRLERFVRDEEARRLTAQLRWLCEELEREKGVRPLLTPTASRGLAYYTGLTFEIHCPAVRFFDTSVCGGGRYDDLHGWVYRRARETRELRGHNGAPSLTGGDLTGVGLAFGIERLADALAGSPSVPREDGRNEP